MRWNRRGNIAIITALMAIPMVGMVGIATDGTRAWLLRSRLLTALDAAALAGARNINLPPAQRDNEVRSMFWTNYRPLGLPALSPPPGAGQPTIGYLDAVTTLDEPAVVDANTLRVSATARLPTTFSRVLGIDELTVRGSAVVRRADLGMEVALVLDVTGSMDTNCTTPSNRTTADCGVTPVPRAPGQTVTARNNNMDLLRVAAADLVNILYGDRDTVTGLWVSVVPYTTAVNVGPSRTSWLTAEAQANLGAMYQPTTWRGCVESRVGLAGQPANGDQRDYTPAEVPFQPFYFRSTLGLYRLNGVVVPGDNDWDRKLWNASTTGGNAITEDWQYWRGNNNVGPNLGCPQTPMLPLTASKTTVLDTIQSLRPTFRSGTAASAGLQMGWAALSPRWRSTWNLGPPPSGQSTSLPLDYNTRFIRKVLVMMTDGQNSLHDGATGYPGACASTSVSTASTPGSGAGFPPPGPAMPHQPIACPSSAAAGTNAANIVAAPGAPVILNNTDYTGYGRLQERRLGAGVTTIAQAATEINNRMEALCTAMKSASGVPGATEDIIIYSVVLDTSGTAVNTATRQLYERCATSPQNFFLVTRPDQLRPAFQQIGTQLANLRIVQ